LAAGLAGITGTRAVVKRAAGQVTMRSRSSTCPKHSSPSPSFNSMPGSRTMTGPPPGKINAVGVNRVAVARDRGVNAVLTGVNGARPGPAGAPKNETGRD
jgi:hypothetical protein